MDQPQSFGRLLRERRKASDLTQEQLAEKVNYSVETIKKIEAGKARPGKQLVERLADYLQLGMEERAAFLQAARGVLGSGTDPTGASSTARWPAPLPSGTVTF